MIYNLYIPVSIYMCSNEHLLIKIMISGGVQEGDSGAGLTFQHSNAHYLTGVVSNKNPDKNDTIALFTDVGVHIQWISNIYTNYYSREQ